MDPPYQTTGTQAATESRDPARVRRMFGGIARRYDLMNHLLSANLDRRWRAATARQAVAGPTERVLDLCGGTGDLTVALARAGVTGTIVCCDFARPMLVVAQQKFRKRKVDDRCLLLESDGLRLPFAEGTFDAVTVGFGIRNFCDMDAGLREIQRVLRPGGRLVVLEFSRPAGPLLGRLYRFYLRRVLPRLGNRGSGSEGAYTYLANTIEGFPEPAVLAGRIRESGFAACGWETATGGIVAIHEAYKHP